MTTSFWRPTSSWRFAAGMTTCRTTCCGSSRRVSWVTDWVTTDAQRPPERAPTARGGPELRGPRALSSAHNPKVAGSNPAPAIGESPAQARFSCVSGHALLFAPLFQLLFQSERCRLSRLAQHLNTGPFLAEPDRTRARCAPRFGVENPKVARWSLTSPGDRSSRFVERHRRRCLVG
jgi:hypothetical protein